jgi:hypothetical protein
MFLQQTAKGLALIAIFSLGPSALRGFADKKQPDTIPLNEAIAVTEAALNDYQTQAESDQATPPKGRIALPPLDTADFDFKTVVDNQVGAGINLFIFSISASRQKERVNDLDFQYKPHQKERKVQMFGKELDKSFYEELIKVLTQSANALGDASMTDVDTNKPYLDLCQLTVTVSFGVKWEEKFGISLPYLVTATGNFQRDDNRVQQVKLTFKVDPKTVASCKAAK